MRLRPGLTVLVFVVLLASLLPILPAAAQSSCTVSTRASNIRMRAGHSTTDAVVGTMPRRTPLQVTERFVETVGRTTRVWYRLVKEEAAPTSTAAEVWVGGRVDTSGDCQNISVVGGAPAAPAAGGSAPAAPVAPGTVILPQSGNWGLTLGNSVNVSCDGIGSADFATGEAMGATVLDALIASSADGFTVDGVGYTRDANGTWNGYYAEASILATGTAYIRVDTPTSILGDMVISFSDVPGCTFKVPFWGSPR